MGRAPCCDKANVKKGPWSPEEDAKLKAHIEQHGTGGNWIALPQKIGLKRCGKSCRLRWLNYLRPNIKHGGFTEEEDNIICSLYISIGSRWSIIASQLPGRTDNDVKNYWNTRLKKKLLGRRKSQSHINRSTVAAQEQEVAINNDEEENENPFLRNLSNSALERLQLHVQLQNLQNPISLLNNLLQEKVMLQPLQNSSMISSTSDHLQLETNQNLNTLKKINDSGNRTSSSIPDNTNAFIHGTKDSEANMTFKQNEIDNSLNDESAGFVTLGCQIPEFDCRKEMNESRDSFMWWSSNEFDSNSASSSSWDSTSLLQYSEGMYHDCGLGYKM